MPETTTPDPTRETVPDAAAAREIDHNNECIGCGVSSADPCQPRCGVATGEFGAAVLLRGAVARLEHNQAGIGYDVAGAVFATALALLGQEWAQREHALALEILGVFLIRRNGAQGLPSRAEAVYRFGLFAPRLDIAAVLYAAAAAHDGVPATD
jgi:hypothetical protein